MNVAGHFKTYPLAVVVRTVALPRWRMTGLLFLHKQRWTNNTNVRCKFVAPPFQTDMTTQRIPKAHPFAVLEAAETVIVK
jgi:hypothetical protein